MPWQSPTHAGRSPQTNRTPDGAGRLLERKIRRAQWAIGLERAWVRLWPPVAVGLVFLIVSALELWAALPSLAHTIVLAGFGLAALASLVPLLRLRIGSREEALARIEARSGIPHRPASAWEDRLAEGDPDPKTAALWSAHRAQLSRQIRRLRVSPPHPRTEKYDPLALRAALVLGAVATVIATAPDLKERLAAAFDVQAPIAARDVRVDAWVTPPVYTGQPPIVLATGDRLDETAGSRIREVTVPAGSVLLIRANAKEGSAPVIRQTMADTTTTLEPKETRPAVAAAGAAAGYSVIEYQVTLDRDQTIAAGGGGLLGGPAASTWVFAVAPDQPPNIGFSAPIDQTVRGSLRLGYRAEDDYGVASARATMIPRDAARLTPRNRAAEQAGTSPAEAVIAREVPLGEPPRITLGLSRANAKTVEGRTLSDLAGHPWAGLPVRLSLIARDQAGQEGRTAPVVIQLPERRFTNPLARALIEQRKSLIQRPRGARPQVKTALDAFSRFPDVFGIETPLYIGLRTAYWRLTHDLSRDGAQSVADQLWAMALRLEDGALSGAEQALRDAQERLSEALQNGTSDAEIAQLMQDLREALQNYLSALADQGRQNPSAQQDMTNPGQTLTEEDFERMLRNLETLAQSGAREMAQQMLNDMRELLEQLQTGQAGPSPEDQAMGEMLQGLGEIIGDQQRLMDETFRQGQQARPGRRGQPQQGQGQQPGQQPGQRGQGQQQGQNPGQGQGMGQGEGQGGSLTDRQRALQGRLGELLEQMDGLGGRLPRSLGEAQRSMGEAGDALGVPDLDQAGQDQNMALDQLRRGANELAEQMRQRMQAQSGNNGRDPLGRPNRTRGPDDGRSVRVPDQVDIQRAREILEELRRRLSDPNRPPVELDYLERLLRRF